MPMAGLLHVASLRWALPGKRTPHSLARQLNRAVCLVIRLFTVHGVNRIFLGEAGGEFIV